MFSNRFYSLFLPVGLAAGIVVGLGHPAPGHWLGDQAPLGLATTKYCIAFVFLVSGLLLKSAELDFGRPFLKAFTAAGIINLGLGPLLATLLVPVLGQGGGTSIGLAVMLCAPTTLSSAIVITRQAGGNTAWAIAMTALMTVLGTLLMPLTLSLVPGLNLNLTTTIDLALGLSGLVLIPLGIGIVFRQFAPTARWTGILPSLGIILVVWMSASKFNQSLLSQGLWDILGWVTLALGCHGLLMFFAWVAGRLLKTSRAESYSLLFVASQKTLPLTLAALLSLPLDAPTLAAAVAFCVVFHYNQIFGDSLLAARLALK